MFQITGVEAYLRCNTVEFPFADRLVYFRMLTNETEANPAACGKGSINRLVLSTTEHGVFNIVLFKKQH
jgi:hypothetical protein